MPGTFLTLPGLQSLTVQLQGYQNTGGLEQEWEFPPTPQFHDLKSTQILPTTFEFTLIFLASYILISAHIISNNNIPKKLRPGVPLKYRRILLWSFCVPKNM